MIGRLVDVLASGTCGNNNTQAPQPLPQVLWADADGIRDLGNLPVVSSEVLKQIPANRSPRGGCSASVARRRRDRRRAQSPDLDPHRPAGALSSDSEDPVTSSRIRIGTGWTHF